MTEYDIPKNVAELFANGERSYRIEDPDQAGDNIMAMSLFLECVGVPDEMVECDDGTQVTLFDGTTRIVIDSGGLGDFHLHGYDVTVATPNAVRCTGVIDDALTVARKTMYQRTIGLTLEESDKLRVWIDATLAEVKKSASSITPSELPTGRDG